MIRVDNGIDVFTEFGWEKIQMITISSCADHDDYVILCTELGRVKIRGSDLIAAIKNAQNSNRFNR